jgi:hypothetical protein
MTCNEYMSLLSVGRASACCLNLEFKKISVSLLKDDLFTILIENICDHKFRLMTELSSSFLEMMKTNDLNMKRNAR